MAQAVAPRTPVAGDWNLPGLAAIALGHGVNDLFSGTVALTIFFVVSSAGLAPWYQGALGFLWYVTSSIVQPFFGAYSDRHGRWWFMPTGILLVVLALSFASLTTSIPMLALLIVVGGFGSAIMHPEAGKYAAMLSGSRKSSGISIFQIGGSLGFAVGPLAMAALLAHFGRNASIVLLVPGLIACAYLYVAIHRADGLARGAHAQRPPVPAATAGPVDTFGVGLVVASTSLRFLASMAFVTYLPNVLIAHGGTIVQAGQIVSAFLTIGIVGMYAGGTLGDRFGSVTVSVASLILAVPCLFGFFLLPAPLSIASLLLGSVFLAVQNAPGVVIVQAMLPKNLGMALGLMNGVAFGAGSALVAVVGIAVARIGPEAALMQISAAPLLAAASYLIIARRLPATILRSRA